MRFSLRHYSLWIAAILLVATTSCSDNDEPDSVDYESLSGVWYGTRCYNNNGAVKYQNITLTLNQDKTGSMEYESDVSFSAARFTWSISGDRLICQGAYASTSGDISGSYNLELLLSAKLKKGESNFLHGRGWAYFLYMTSPLSSFQYLWVVILQLRQA